MESLSGRAKAASVMVRFVEREKARKLDNWKHFWTPAFVIDSQAARSNSAISGHPSTMLATPSSEMPFPHRFKNCNWRHDTPSLRRVLSVMFLHSERSSWSKLAPLSFSDSDMHSNPSSVISTHLRRIRDCRFVDTTRRLCTEASL